MKLYREKYGRGLGGSDDKNVQRKGQRHGGEQHPQEPTKSAPSNGGNTKNGTSRGAPGQSQNRNPTEGPDKNQYILKRCHSNRSHRLRPRARDS